MLCSACTKIFNASSERIDENEKSYFRHHSASRALRAAAESGCQLCQTLLAQLPEDLGRQVDNSLHYEGDQSFAESRSLKDSDVRYTLDDLQSDQGKYILDVRVNIGGETSLARVYFVREEVSHPERESLRPRLISLDDSLSLAQHWINTCLTMHTQCRKPDEKLVHNFARVLEVEFKGQDYSLRLVEGSEILAGSRYVTLSHCWGGISITKLTSTNYKSFCKSISYEALPKTFRDAIEITRLLSVRYLWVDSLCIVQDSVEDWQNQAPQMGQIYHNSWCNLAATAAKDGRDGLFRFLDRRPQTLEPLFVDVPDMGQPKFHELGDSDPTSFEPGAWRGSPHPREGTLWQGMSPGLYECIDRDLWFRNVSDSPLGRRAWVVQERLLAPRVLHFGRGQLFWECNALKACELYPDGLPDKADLLSSAELKCQEITSGYEYQSTSSITEEWNMIGPSPRILQSWHDVVGNYSRANLTFESDKLAALAGLASLFAARVYAAYLGGIWAVHLPRQLMWAIRWPNQPPEKLMAPSWSWASVNGELRNTVAIDDTIAERLASISHIKCSGSLLEAGGYLLLKGRLIPCILSCDTEARPDKQCNPLVRGLECAAFVQPDTDNFRRVDLSSNSYFCLPFLIFYDATEPSTPEVAGLVLESTKEKGTFRRFGAFRTNNAMDRDGDRHPDWVYDDSVQPRTRTRYGRVFLMDVEDELAEVDEQFYLSYESAPAKRTFANFTFVII